MITTFQAGYGLTLLAVLAIFIYLSCSLIKSLGCKKTIKKIDLSAVLFLLSQLIWIVSRVRIVFDINKGVSLKIMFAIGFTDIIHHVSKGYFLKAKLTKTYKDTFLSIHQPFINTCFAIFCVSSSLHVIFFYWYNVEPMHALSRIQWHVTEITYSILILTLFNKKLYHFISFTMSNDQILSSQINDTVKQRITKQTNLISLMIFSSLVYYMAYYTTYHRYDNVIYESVMMTYTVIEAICVFLTFKCNDKKYYKCCKCCHLICLYLCTEVVMCRNSRNKKRELGDKDGYISTMISMEMNKISKKHSFSYICMENEECYVMEKMINLLNISNDNNLLKYIDSNNYQITDILNDFDHVLHYHDNEYYFSFIHDQLTEKCQIQNCINYQRNYRRRIINDIYPSNEYQQNVFLNVYDKIHSFYYHSYDTFLRIRSSQNNNVDEKLKFLKKSNSERNALNTTRKINKFNTNLTMNNDNNKIYSFGQRFEYNDDKNEWYVPPKYHNLKHELLNNGISNLEMEVYMIENEKCTNFMKTEHVRLLTNNSAKSLKNRNILSLLIYCNCDDFQNKWSSTYRRITRMSLDENDLSLKKRHSHFYFQIRLCGCNFLMKLHFFRNIEEKMDRKIKMMDFGDAMCLQPIF